MKSAPIALTIAALIVVWCLGRLQQSAAAYEKLSQQPAIVKEIRIYDHYVAGIGVVASSYSGEVKAGTYHSNRIQFASWIPIGAPCLLLRSSTGNEYVVDEFPSRYGFLISFHKNELLWGGIGLSIYLFILICVYAGWTNAVKIGAGSFPANKSYLEKTEWWASLAARLALVLVCFPVSWTLTILLYSKLKDHALQYTIATGAITFAAILGFTALPPTLWLAKEKGGRIQKTFSNIFKAFGIVSLGSLFIYFCFFPDEAKVGDMLKAIRDILK